MKLTQEECDEIRRMYADRTRDVGTRSLSHLFRVSQATINKVLNGKYTAKPRLPLCVNCKTKPARIGKEQGFPANLFCTTRCAYLESLGRHMDSTVCGNCGQWSEVCECK